MVVGAARREGEPRIGPSREQVRVHLELLVHLVNRGDVHDMQADGDFERLAVVGRRLQDQIGRDAGWSLCGVDRRWR